jgi:predicted metalloprotease with PDZ domain
MRPELGIDQGAALVCRRMRSGLAALAVAGGLFAGSAGGAHAEGLQLGDAWSQTLLLLHGHSHGLLGVYVGDVDQERAQSLHLKESRGAEITLLDHDAPASKAGLKLHDVIVRMNGESIENAEQVRRMLHDTPPGKKVQMVISRDGAEVNYTVQMGDRRKVQEEAWDELGTMGASSVPAQGFLGGGGNAPSGGFHMPFFGSSLHVGVMVEPLTAQMADFLGVTGGVMIKSVAHKSAADAAGLKAHDVILEVGGERVVTSSDWERLLRTSDGKPVQVAIFRDRSKQLVLLQVDGKRH